MKKKNVVKLLLTLIASMISFIPFYITINVAFKPMTDMTSRWILPKELYLGNFVTAIEKANIFGAMKNSLIITLISVLIIVLVGAMAAYPLARIRNKFNRGVLNLILAIMMVPPLSILVPLYSNLSKMGGISTYWGIIIIIATFQLPLSIFIYTNFIISIPRTIDEAAMIDGCNDFQIYYKIILPLLKPVTATVIILTCVAAWNDYQFSLFFLQDPKMRTVTLAISSFFSQSSSNLNAAAAAALMAIVPVVIIYIMLQKYFVKGMIDSAIK
ncbi:MAG: carbohydrate ABC transporter permease [Clostridiales bacterium]|nr:carbohydrate ABC transporter permease [Clostridiales bacterium]